MIGHLILIGYFLLATSVSALRLFLIGGHAFEKSELFNYIAAAVPNRTPMPNKCIEDWSTTLCPRVAVVTSSHPTLERGT
jgi:hypothetical protein